jgi:hypothetical protein
MKKVLLKIEYCNIDFCFEKFHRKNNMLDIN